MDAARAAGSTTGRTRATPWSARSTRRPGWSAEVGEQAAGLLRALCRTPGATASAWTTTRCGSCTTAGCRPARPTPRVRRGRRVDRRGGLAPAGRRAVDGSGAGGADGDRGARRPRAAAPPAGGDVRPHPPRRHRAAGPDLRPGATTAARGRCPAAGWTTGRRRPRRWCARCARSAASAASSGTCSACTTCTSPAPRRPGGSRTSTASPWSSPPRRRRRRAATCGGRRHHRRGRLGAAGGHRVRSGAGARRRPRTALADL